ncbi:MAG: 16S rRNA (adenine(1518)-N(6)/adenine(1519)-N(6))-dimethyltransferase RsmA [Cytophagales bacterium]|nr:16S rRNA (adenine(1518)-N(6)/adenine(1519)-N(6))-dimethyltransferase RsmA [Cytophagales bacterium]
MFHPKKRLGQHFLKDKKAILQIVSLLKGYGGYSSVLEIGPGKGALTRPLYAEYKNLYAIDIDPEVIYFLKNDPFLKNLKNLHLIQGDIRSFPIDRLPDPLGIIGNLPYALGSDIMMHVLNYKDQVPEIIFMLQKEVAERVASPCGSRKYGKISVWIQTYYEVEYIFSLPPESFFPPPMIKSGVLRLRRNDRKKLPLPESFFREVVKKAFMQRRKRLANALRELIPKSSKLSPQLLNKRAEELSANEFIQLSQKIYLDSKPNLNKIIEYNKGNQGQ